MILPFVRDLLADAETLPAFLRAAAHLKGGTGRIRLSGLTDTAKPLLYAQLHHSISRPLIVLVANNRAAEEMLPVLQSFCELTGAASVDSVVYLPARDVLPFENLSPHPEIQEARAKALWRIATGAVSMWLRRLPPARGCCASPVVGIVEDKDATDDQRKVREINSGIYIFDNAHLFDALGHITTHNAQNEYYLTDVFRYYWEHGMKVAAKKTFESDEVRGINTVEQLQEANEVSPKGTPFVPLLFKDMSVLTMSPFFFIITLGAA